MTTLKDLSEKLNLSTATISYVLNGQGDARRVSKQTQELVRKTASEMGYVPNVIAKSLRVSQNAPIAVGVFLSCDDRLYLMTRFQFGLHRAAQDTDSNIRFIYYLYEPGKLCEESGLFEKTELNAAIICNTAEADDVYLHEHPLPIPAVIVAREHDDYCTIKVDEKMTGIMAATALAANGCRSIIALEGNADLKYHYSGINRRGEGFAETAEKLGIRYKIQNRYADIEKNLRFLDENDPMYFECDGIYTGDGRLIGPLLKKLREKDISVPSDMKLITLSLFGPEYLSATFTPGISTIAHPLEEEARISLSMVLGQLNGTIKEPQSTTLYTKYIPYESCGPLPDSFVLPKTGDKE